MGLFFFTLSHKKKITRYEMLIHKFTKSNVPKTNLNNSNKKIDRKNPAKKKG